MITLAAAPELAKESVDLGLDALHVGNGAVEFPNAFVEAFSDVVVVVVVRHIA